MLILDCPLCGASWRVINNGLRLGSCSMVCPNGHRVTKLLRKQRRAWRVQRAAEAAGMSEADYRAGRRFRANCGRFSITFGSTMTKAGNEPEKPVLRVILMKSIPAKYVMRRDWTCWNCGAEGKANDLSTHPPRGWIPLDKGFAGIQARCPACIASGKKTRYRKEAP